MINSGLFMCINLLRRETAAVVLDKHMKESRCGCCGGAEVELQTESNQRRFTLWPPEGARAAGLMLSKEEEDAGVQGDRSSCGFSLCGSMNSGCLILRR